MFKAKYVAVNDLTGIQIKTFRTKSGAQRWYRKPAMRIQSTSFSKAACFISIYEIDN